MCSQGDGARVTDLRCPPQVSVFDANVVTKNELIGSYQFDVTFVYLKEHHELYHQWVGLMNEEADHDEDDVGVQGYLQLSVVVLGPGDKQKVHTAEEEEALRFGDGPGDGEDATMKITTLLMPPTIKQELHFLVITFHMVRPPLLHACVLHPMILTSRDAWLCVSVCLVCTLFRHAACRLWTRASCRALAPVSMRSRR